MINYNGELQSADNKQLSFNNRGFKYGDALFETMRVINGKIMFAEEHYLRLMASMRILRMEIPMTFTMEYFEEQILLGVNANNFEDKVVKARFNVFRNDGGLYTPLTNDITFYIEYEPLSTPFYVIGTEEYEVELFKDFYQAPGLLSTLKTTNKVLQITGSIFAKENGLQNCLVLNTDKNVVEALNGNVFLRTGNLLKTPPLADGCLNGIIRKQIIKLIKGMDTIQWEESSISPFELQKADELFITNTVIGIRSVTKYRKKIYTAEMASGLIGKLNAAARLS